MNIKTFFVCVCSWIFSVCDPWWRQTFYLFCHKLFVIGFVDSKFYSKINKHLKCSKFIRKMFNKHMFHRYKYDENQIIADARDSLSNNFQSLLIKIIQTIFTKWKHNSIECTRTFCCWINWENKCELLGLVNWMQFNLIRHFCVRHLCNV